MTNSGDIEHQLQMAEDVHLPETASGDPPDTGDVPQSRIIVISRASFCCSKKVRKLHLFSTKVAFMRSKLHLCAHLTVKYLTQPIFVCADLAKSQDFMHFHL